MDAVVLADVDAVVLADADAVSAAVESSGADDATDPDDAGLDVAVLAVAVLDAPVADDAVLDAAMLDGKPAVADCAVVLASPDPLEHPCATRTIIAVMPTIIPALVLPVACLMHR